MKAGEADDHPHAIPMKQCYVMTGVKAEIQQPAARNQSKHGEEENPIQDDVEGAQPWVSLFEKSSQANFVEPNAARETGTHQIRHVSERQGNKHHGGLHVRHPDALPRQDNVEQIDPAASGRFRCDA